MKVGVIQSNFLPWRGYFDFIREVDLFIIHDDLQYTKGDWRNRNRIKTARGAEWITVPVGHVRTNQRIDETPVSYSSPWSRKMLNRIQESYRRAPYFGNYFTELDRLISEPASSISALNVRLIHWICRILGIGTTIQMSRDFAPVGSKSARLIDILSRAQATEYLSGPAAQAYIEPELFERAGITLRYKDYALPEYPQLYPPFDPAVSVIDLLFMTGTAAPQYLGRTETNHGP